MNTEQKEIIILNLAGDLSGEISGYLSSRNLKVVDPLLSSETYAWTHILTKDIHDFSLIRQNYRTLENDVKIISLSSVNDIQNFLFSNGKLVFDELWMSDGLGSFILDKFFQEFGGINPADNYPHFQEQGSFKVLNPFSTGEYLDRLVHQAFQTGNSALSVKTFFDHFLMFLTGLRTKGKVGLPFEVVYGSFNNVFAVQFHFLTQSLMLEDVTCSLTKSITKKAEEYYLNVAVQAADFFDFTFLHEVNKATITALWTQDERIKFENKGLLFTHLSSSSAISGYPIEGVTSQLTEDSAITDMSEKVVLPEIKNAEDEETRISGAKFSEALSEKIASNMELDKVKQIISGKLQEDIFAQNIAGFMPDGEDVTVVKGGIEDDVKIRISSKEKLNEMINLVKGSLDQEKASFLLSKGEPDVAGLAMKVISGLGNAVKGEHSLKNTILQQKLPESIKQGLFDFARGLNKDISELSEAEINAFRDFDLPMIVKKHTDVGEDHLQSQNFFQKFKKDLEKGLLEEFHEDSIGDLLAAISTPEDVLRVKSALKNSLKSSLEEKFHLGSKNNLSDDDQAILVKSLSASLAEDEDKIKTIIALNKAENNEALVTPLFLSAPLSEAERKLEQKLTLVNAENERLKSKIMTMMNEMRVVKDAKSHFQDLQNQAMQSAALKTLSPSKDVDASLRDEFRQKLSGQQNINQDEAQKLAEFLERENNYINNLKAEEVKFKKLQLEMTQKESFFATELEKLQRHNKAKDLIITKSKESLAKLMEKKEFEIQDLQQKIDQMNKLMANSQAQSQASYIVELEKNNENLAKMVDVYKNKMTSLANNIQRQSMKAAEEGLSKDEFRKLHMLNNQYKNMLDANKKEIQRLQDKGNLETGMLTSLKLEKVQLEQQLKKALFDLSREKDKSNVRPAFSEDEFLQLQSTSQQLETQLKEAYAKLKDSEARIVDLQKLQKPQASNDDASKVKMNQLDTTVKKLTQDLIESRNQMAEMKKETNKLRQEKTALQNQIDKMKKEMEKAAKAAVQTKNKAA